MVTPPQVDANAPWVVYQHGTSVDRNQVPSRGDNESTFSACILASLRKNVVMADYVGLGDSPGFHPYLHAQTEASAAADLILAVAEQEKIEHVDLLITGYSQGGHAAMALHRALEQTPDSRISVVASSPMSGPYEPAGASLEGSLTEPEPYFTTLFAAYLVVAYQDIYRDIYATPEEIFQPTFANVPAIFRTQEVVQIFPAMPQFPADLFRENFLSSLLSPFDHPFRKRLQENDLTEWTPVAPIQFVYAGGDKTVQPANSKNAYAKLGERSKNLTLVNVGDTLGHGAAMGPAFAATLAFFQSIQQ